MSSKVATRAVVRTVILGAALGLAPAVLLAAAPAGADLPGGSTTTHDLGGPPAAPTTVPTSGPTTSGPTTSGPTTTGPTTSGPTTSGPTTSGPTTSGPTTSGSTTTSGGTGAPRSGGGTGAGGGSASGTGSGDPGGPGDASGVGASATGSGEPDPAPGAAPPDDGTDATATATGTGDRAAVAGADPAGTGGTAGRERRRVDDERPVPARVLAVRAAVAAGGTGLVAVVAGGAFFCAQGWIDRRDPKLALSPLRPSPPLSFPTEAKAWTDVAG